MHLVGHAEEAPEDAELVQAVVEDEGPAAVALEVEAPLGGTGRDLPAARGIAREALLADREDLPDVARAHELDEPRHGWVEEEVLEDAHDLAARRGSLGRLHEPPALGDREAHRLLDREVLAGRQRRQRDLQMHVMRQQDLEGVDRLVGQAVAPVGIDPLGLDAPAARPRQGALGVRLADGRDHGVRGPHVLDGMQVADATRTDDGHPEALACSAHPDPLLGRAGRGRRPTAARARLIP